jgi:putative phosphoribosyl transferase
MLQAEPIFKNRREAGEALAARLIQYRGTHPLVLGIPRGGVETGFHVCRQLDGELSVVISKKIPHPQQPEYAIGAVSEEGDRYLDEDAGQFAADIPSILARLQEEIRRRVRLYREGKPLPEMRGRTVIITDDGIATGATVAAAVLLCRRKQAAKIIVAAPVAGRSFATPILEADEIVVLSKPEIFFGVGQVYEDFSQLTDARVLDLLKSSRGNHVE